MGHEAYQRDDGDDDDDKPASGPSGTGIHSVGGKCGTVVNRPDMGASML